MALRADIELDAGGKTFVTGLLIELIAALRHIRLGDLVAVTAYDRTIGTELEAWCRQFLLRSKRQLHGSW